MRRSDEYYSGFYVNKEKLETIKNEKYDLIQNDDSDATDYLYEDASIFLHGSCNLFALALHEKFNYTVYEIRDIEDRVIHIFCKCDYFGKDAFIDVRGITTDFSAFFEEFPPYSSTSIRNLDEDILLKEDGDIVGMRFAKDIIDQYAEFYRLK